MTKINIQDTTTTCDEDIAPDDFSNDENAKQVNFHKMSLCLCDNRGNEPVEPHKYIFKGSLNRPRRVRTYAQGPDNVRPPWATPSPPGDIWKNEQGQTPLLEHTTNVTKHFSPLLDQQIGQFCQHKRLADTSVIMTLPILEPQAITQAIPPDTKVKVEFWVNSFQPAWPTSQSISPS